MKILVILLGVFFIAFVVIQLFASRGQVNIETYPYVINKKYGFMCLYKQFEDDTYYIVNNVGTYSLDLQGSTEGSYKDYPVPSVIRFIPYQKQTTQQENKTVKGFKKADN